MDKKTVKLNEKTISESEFKKKKKEVDQMKGAKIVEVGKGEFRIRLYD